VRASISLIRHGERQLGDGPSHGRVDGAIWRLRPDAVKKLVENRLESSLMSRFADRWPLADGLGEDLGGGR